MKIKTHFLSLLVILLLFIYIPVLSLAQTQSNTKKIYSVQPSGQIRITPPDEMQLKVPFIPQENAPNCWAASLLMITEAVRPSTDYNVYRLTYRSGEFDGTFVPLMPENIFIREEGERRTGKERLVERWFLSSTNEQTVTDYIKDQIGNFKRPVLFCTSTSMETTTGAHCVVIVGYKTDLSNPIKGDEITIHNPQNVAGNIDIYRKTKWDFIFNREFNMDGRTRRAEYRFRPMYVAMSIPSPIDMSSDYNFLKVYFCNEAFSLRSALQRGLVYYQCNWTVPDGYVWNNSRNGRIPESYDQLTIGLNNTINVINTSDNNINLKICFSLESVDRSERKPLFCSRSFTAKPGQRASCPDQKIISLSSLDGILKKDPNGNNKDYVISVQYIDTSNDNIIHTEFIKFPHDPISEGLAKLTVKNTIDNKYIFYVIPDRLLNKQDLWRYKFVITELSTKKETEIISENDQTKEVRLAIPGKYRIDAFILKVNDAFIKGNYNNPRNYTIHATDKIELEVPPFINITKKEDNNKYIFKAIPALNEPPVTKTYKWFLKANNETQFAELSEKKDEINHTFLKEGTYDVKVQMIDLNGNPIVENTISVDVKTSSSIEEEAKKAYENKDWKKLFELYDNAKDKGDKSIVYDYIEKLATDFNTKNEEDIKLLKEYKTKNDNAFNNFNTAINNAREKLKDSPDKLKNLDNCLKTTKTLYDKENQKIEKAISILEGLLNLYKSQKNSNMFTISYFENYEQKRKETGYDFSTSLPVPTYDTRCIPDLENETKEEDKNKKENDPSTNKPERKGDGNCNDEYQDIVFKINVLNNLKQDVEKAIKDNDQANKIASKDLVKVQQILLKLKSPATNNSQQDSGSIDDGKTKFKSIKNVNLELLEEQNYYLSLEECLNNVIDKSNKNIPALKQLLNEINTTIADAERIKKLIEEEVPPQNTQSSGNIVTDLEGEDPFAKKTSCKHELEAINVLSEIDKLITKTQNDLLTNKAPEGCGSIKGINEEEVQKATVELDSDKNDIRCKDTITFTATVSGDQADKYFWKGYPLEADLVETTTNTITFPVNVCESFSLEVTAVKEGKVLGKAYKDISVSSGAIGTVSGLNSTEIFGTSKNISIIPFDDYKDIIDNKNTINWFSNRDFEFAPPKALIPSTKVTFTRLENPSLVWAEVISDKVETIGETEQFSVKILPPTFKLDFNQPLNAINVGEPVKMSVKISENINKDLITFRWIEPETLIGPDTLEFTPENTDTVKVKVLMVSSHYGDELGALTSEFKPVEYNVSAQVLKAKYSSAVEIWDPKEGLVEAKNAFAEGQEILLEADIDGYPSENTKYNWSVIDGCRLTAGSISQVSTVVADKAGTCKAKVIAKGKNNIRLGEATVSFDVTITQDQINQAKEKDKEMKAKAELEEKKKQAEEKLKEAKKDHSLGNIDEAITKTEEAIQLDPTNIEAKGFLNKIKAEKDQYLAIANDAKSYLDKNDTNQAQFRIGQIPSNFINYKPIKDIYDLIQQKKADNNALSSKLIEEENSAIGLANECKYDEAIAMTEDIIERDPFKGTQKEYKSARHWLEQFTKNKATVEDLIQKAKDSIAEKDYKNAYQYAYTANSINKNCPGVSELLAIAEKNKNQSANTNQKVYNPGNIYTSSSGDLEKNKLTSISTTTTKTTGKVYNPGNIYTSSSSDLKNNKSTSISTNTGNNTGKVYNPGNIYTSSNTDLKNKTSNIVPIAPDVSKPPVVPIAPDVSRPPQISSTPSNQRSNLSSKETNIALEECKKAEKLYIQRYVINAYELYEKTFKQYQHIVYNDNKFKYYRDQRDAIVVYLNTLGKAYSKYRDVIDIVEGKKSVNRPTYQLSNRMREAARVVMAIPLCRTYNTDILGNKLLATADAYEKSLKQQTISSSSSSTYSGSNTYGQNNKTSKPTYSTSNQTKSYCTVTPLNRTPATAEEYYKQGQYDLSRGAYTVAAMSFRKAYFKETNNVKYIKAYGVCSIMTGYKSDAIASLKRVIKLYPSQTNEMQKLINIMSSPQYEQIRLDAIKQLRQKSSGSNSLLVNAVISIMCNSTTQRTSITQTSYTKPSNTNTSIVGNWYFYQCDKYSANLEIRGSGGNLTGRINFHILGQWEPITNIRYNSSTGQISFFRSKYPQTHTGKLVGNKMSGTLNRDDKKPGSGICNWTATKN